MWDKFMDHYVHFESTRTGMRTRDKFKNRNENWGKFKDYYMHFKSTGIKMRTRNKFMDRR